MNILTLMWTLICEGINIDKKDDAMVVGHFPFAASLQYLRLGYMQQPVDYRVTVWLDYL